MLQGLVRYFVVQDLPYGSFHKAHGINLLPSKAYMSNLTPIPRMVMLEPPFSSGDSSM